MASSEHHLSALPNGWPRITESSPVRDLGGIMDYERCAALHNELLTRALTGCGGEIPPMPPSWWDARAPSEEVANSLHPSLIEFLKRAWDEDVLPPRSRLFVFLAALKSPDNMRDHMDSYEDEYEEGRFIKLYESSHYRVSDDEGLLFDQMTLRATFIEDINDTRLITRHEWSWMPLEVILDSYLQMIDEGKAQAVSKDQAKLLKMDFLYGLMEPWVIHQYTKTDLERATTAFKRLVEVIESRIPPREDPTTFMNLPWHDPATFENQDVLPRLSFAHEFLRSISDCSVRFCYIAPGIRFPTVFEFQNQPITDFVTSPHNHLGQYPGNCPLRIFQIDDAEYHQPVARGNHLGLYNIAAGFYIDPVVQQWPLFWSNVCRLLLPFAIGGSGWARMSNGQPFGITDSDYLDKYPEPRDSHGDLYQNGTINGITNSDMVQIDKVLNNWADRVERGDWVVDEDGVAGVSISFERQIQRRIGRSIGFHRRGEVCM
ncbi:hypothetical protein ASPVEDRAFT_44747 [Aspergillus versicolor CBS 583.65]|uniref:Uncharacterized protein n=1 Tax=Aspergillus versicolor CBS 583.65 TaxID=1036611 RepID=A0A1L9PUK1_ASPVE|nr:uncharacterized protein ASPVEDRAFT_44747 [Aspergillus versicolor CBS 583.65]OJJ05224.1 hypothetical protein ASPVEDRAFT_44747 [Aspergillus versicolor CBS 583.65]